MRRPQARSDGARAPRRAALSGEGHEERWPGYIGFRCARWPRGVSLRSGMPASTASP